MQAFAVVYYQSGGRSPHKIVHGIWSNKEAAELAQATLLGATAVPHINNTFRNDHGVVSWVSELTMNAAIDWDLVTRIAQPV